MSTVRAPPPVACCASTPGTASSTLTTSPPNALKRIAIGRKNWLFAGRDEAAGSAAILTRLIASAQRHGIGAQAYLTGILVRVASTSTSQLEQFLPERWNKPSAT